LGFAAALAVLTCLLFGLAPALRATRIEPSVVMKVGGRGLTAGRERFSLRRTLVVVQVALSLVLVAGAVLFTRSLDKLLKIDTGFRQEGITIIDLAFGRLKVPPERRLAFKDELLGRIKAIPGIEAATDTNLVPLSGNATDNLVWLDGAATQKLNTNFSQVGPDYFRMLDTPLLAGREFNDRDTANTPKVAIVNETFARRLLNGANPVGHRFWIEATPTDPETVYEIVGLVRDTKYEDIREEFSPIAFLAKSQDLQPAPNGLLLIRS